MSGRLALTEVQCWGLFQLSKYCLIIAIHCRTDFINMDVETLSLKLAINIQSGDIYKLTDLIGWLVWLNKLAESIQVQLMNFGTIEFLRQS